MRENLSKGRRFTSRSQDRGRGLNGGFDGGRWKLFSGCRILFGAIVISVGSILSLAGTIGLGTMLGIRAMETQPAPVATSGSEVPKAPVSSAKACAYFGRSRCDTPTCGARPRARLQLCSPASSGTVTVRTWSPFRMC